MGIEKIGILLLSMTVLVTAGFVSNQAFAGPPTLPLVTVNAIPTGSAAQSNLHPDGPFDGAAIVNIPAVTLQACDPESDCFSLLKQIDFSGFPVNPLMTITIHEEFIVGEGSPEWWDWHERIITIPGWAFTGSALIMKVPPGGFCDVVAGTNFNFNPDTEIWFDFEGNIGGLNLGDKLCVWKDVIWVSPTSSQFTGILEIIEWPTIHKSTAVGGEIIPLDTTMVLLAGTQHTAAWMIPAIVSAIGIGIVIARKF